MKKTEEKLLNEVQRHYDLAKEDLEVRLPDFDKADELFRSYIDEDDWPYSAMIFLPRVFTSIFEKGARLIGSKPRGRLIPRESGDVLGSKINNALLEFQWDDATRVDNEPLVAKWAMLDQNARKYGASFAMAKWHYEKRGSEVWFDGPTMKVLNNRDCLLNPSYSSVKNWFQYREYLTLDELVNVNDAARNAPVYKNLDELREKIKGEMKVMDTRESNYEVRNKTMKGYTDYLGRDEFNKVIEIVTEYRPDKWITFAPKHGIVIRDIPNPYKHGEIPVFMLRYYAIDDDIYGIPEWEPIEKPQKALNAITSQYIDATNIELHSPIGVDSTRVRMHTLELGPNKKWIVTGDPRSAIVKYDFGSPGAIASYQTAYKILVGEIQEGLGETSQANSNVDPLQAGKKTATEIKDTAQQRLARDNFNQIFLAEALKKQMMFWLSMNKQFLFNGEEQEKILRIVGKDYLEYFKTRGLDQTGLEPDAEEAIAEAEGQGMQMDTRDFMTPLYPVNTPQGTIPKMELEQDGSMGTIHVTPDDLDGMYDYIPDMGTMDPPNQEQVLSSKLRAIDMLKDPAMQQMLQLEGKTPKMSELIEDTLEDLGFKDASKYFTSSNQMNGQEQIGQPVPGGAGIIPPGQPGIGNVQNGGMGAMPQVPPGQNQQLMAGPPGVQGQ